MAEALAEAALHHRPRHQEGDDDQQDGAVGEAGVGLRGGQRAGEHRRREREDRGGQDRKGADDDREDGGDEEREEVPRRGRQPLGNRREPESRGRGPAIASARDELLAAARGCRSSRPSARRTRPFRLDRPALDRRRPRPATTYCQVKRVLAVEPGVAAGAAGEGAGNAPPGLRACSPVSLLKTRSPCSSVHTHRPTLSPWPSSKPIASPRKPRLRALGRADVPATHRGARTACGRLRWPRRRPRWPSRLPPCPMADQLPCEAPAIAPAPGDASCPAPAECQARAAASAHGSDAPPARPRARPSLPRTPSGPVIAAGSRTLAICSSVRIFFSRRARGCRGRSSSPRRPARWRGRSR